MIGRTIYASDRSSSIFIVIRARRRMFIWNISKTFFFLDNGNEWNLSPEFLHAPDMWQKFEAR